MGKKKKAAAESARAAEIAAELERRERKAAKLAAKKADKKADKRDLKSAEKAAAASEASNAKAAKKAKKGKASVPASVREEAPETVADKAVTTDEANAIADAKAARKAARESSIDKAMRDHAEVSARMAEASDLPTRDEVIDAADKVIYGNSTDGAKAKAKAAKAAAKEADPDESTASIRERVQRKAAERRELEELAPTIDRADAEAVRAYNERAVKLGLTLLTSDEERERMAAHVTDPEPDAYETYRDTAEAAGEKPLSKHKFLERAKRQMSGEGSMVADPVAAKTIANVRDAVEAGDDDLARVVAEAGIAEMKHEVEAVETERGREFAAGPAAPDDDFAQPSEAPRADFEVNGLGQYKVKRPSDGKLVGYTRVTTYIDAIEDSSRLVLWKLRTLLEGVALASEPGEREDAVSALRDLTHRRDVAIAKARKKDRKGELEPGELAQRVAAAEKDFRAAVDKLADELLDLGGAKDKANKGTDLHALFEIVDDPKRGMPEIHRMRQQDVITPADVRDCMAWADAMATLGAKIIDVERVIVNDAVPVPRFLPEAEYGGKPPKTIGVAGRLDRTAFVKLPGRQRAGRYVVDAKTGATLDFSAGKIARQLHMYANAQGYDLNTHEREDLKLDKKVGIVVHVPAGTGEAHVYLVDLTLGAKGNKVAADVRAMRNEGKKAIDLSVDLLDVIRAEEKYA